jgi:hypothetical protein
MNRHLVLCVLFLALVIVRPCFAEIEKVKFESRHTMRLATSNSDDSFYLSRVQSLIYYDISRVAHTIRIVPFFEYQHNIDTNRWWRKEIGIEIGSFFWNNLFYYGASLQHIWQQEQNYPIELLKQTTEWESRFLFTFPIQWKIFKDRLNLQFFDEYTYDFKRGQTTFNEVGITFNWQIMKGLEVPFGWRHIDRVHDYDADLIELSISFSF